MLVVFLVFAGITLFVNGVRLVMDQSDKALSASDVAVLNLFTGILGLFIVCTNLVRGSPGELASAAYIGLFALTYSWLGLNAFTGANGRAFGWFSLLVPFIGVPAGIAAWTTSSSVFDTWMAINWFAWSFLWFLFFLLLARDFRILKATGILTAVQGIATALIPAILHFSGWI